MSFDSIPIIDLSLYKNEKTKQEVLESLRNALFKVGFLYLINHGVEEKIETLFKYIPEIFALSKDDKNSINMINSPHFVGYTSLGAETTAGVTDIREQFDFGSCVEDSIWDASQPSWKRLNGISQFPPEEKLPGFKNAIRDYLNSLNLLAIDFLHLVCESLNIPKDSLDSYIGAMSRLKLIKYPGSNPKESQGVGPHKDSSNIFTFLVQDQVGGLQVLNPKGEWIPATPLKNSFVINIARGFEALTDGRCCATLHRVIAPSNDITRYSIAYFHSIRLDLTRQDVVKNLNFLSDKFPHSDDDNERRNYNSINEFFQPQYKNLGEAYLRNRILSHPDVGAKWYPDEYNKYVVNK